MQLHALQPVQDEQRALNAAQLAQADGQAALARLLTQEKLVAQHIDHVRCRAKVTPPVGCRFALYFRKTNCAAVHHEDKLPPTDTVVQPDRA